RRKRKLRLGVKIIPTLKLNYTDPFIMIKKFTFPPQEELERVRKRIARTDRRTNIGLSPNASPIEKAKYKLCKVILSYKQDNNLTTEEIAEQLGLNVSKTEQILYSHID